MFLNGIGVTVGVTHSAARSCEANEALASVFGQPRHHSRRQRRVKKPLKSAVPTLKAIEASLLQSLQRDLFWSEELSESFHSKGIAYGAARSGNRSH